MLSTTADMSTMSASMMMDQSSLAGGGDEHQRAEAAKTEALKTENLPSN